MMSNLETKLNDRFRAARPLTLAKLPFKVAVAVMAVIALPLAAYLVYDAYQSLQASRSPKLKIKSCRKRKFYHE